MKDEINPQKASSARPVLRQLAQIGWASMSLRTAHTIPNPMGLQEHFDFNRGGNSAISAFSFVNKALD
jgi:hypothetical protein